MTRQKVSAVRPEPIISRPLRLANVGKGASDADQTTLDLNDPPCGQAAMLRKLLYSIDAALQHLKAAAAEQSKDPDHWDCLLRVISE